MTDNRIKIRKHITACLTGYVRYVRTLSRENLNNDARLAEGRFGDLLNIIYGWDLTNTNRKKRNAWGIDLHDTRRKIMVQVSVTDTRKKMNHTFKVLRDTVEMHTRYAGYRLVFMFVSENTRKLGEGRGYRGVPGFLTFDRKSDILDVSTLLSGIGRMPQEQLEAIEQICSAMFEVFPFFSKNSEYQEKRTRLESIIAEIKKIESIIAQNPGIDYLEQRASELLVARGTLEEELSQDVQNILDLAQHISRQQHKKISERMQAAIEAFNRGDFAAAKRILDVAEREFDTNCLSAEHLLSTIFEGLAELQMKVVSIMADVSIDIETRKSKAIALWRKIVETSQLYNYSAHDADKNDDLLDACYDFLQKYGHYQEALDLQMQLLMQRMKVYGADHFKTGVSCNDIGYLLYELDRSPEAITYLERAIAIKEKSLGTNHPSTAISYNNLGLAFDNIGEYAKAIECHQKALALRLRTIGENHPYTAASYSNLGGVYDSLGEYDKALEYYLKDQEISTRLYGKNHLETGWSYKNIAGIHASRGEYPEAIEYYATALSIWTEWLGPEHPHTIKVQELLDEAKSKLLSLTVAL